LKQKESPSFSFLPQGLEIAGEIVATSAGNQFSIGDNVCALVNGGGYAEYCAVPAGQCLPVPPDYSMIQAACVPETFFTCWYNLFQQGRLQAGQTLLVHGGSSGIGTTAIQMASAFGVEVIVTAGSDEKCDACTKLGATHAINYRDVDFFDAVKEATGGKGRDAINRLYWAKVGMLLIDCTGQR
jgi:NADPH:quinone reductase-like Zn-dependent oxidoreductase